MCIQNNLCIPALKYSTIFFSYVLGGGALCMELLTKQVRNESNKSYELLFFPSNNEGNVIMSFSVCLIRAGAVPIP